MSTNFHKCAEYTYYQNAGPKAQAGIQWMHTNPDLKDMLEFKENQHAYMMGIAGAGLSETDAYLSMAPKGLQYPDLAKARCLNLRHAVLVCFCPFSLAKVEVRLGHTSRRNFRWSLMAALGW